MHGKFLVITLKECDSEGSRKLLNLNQIAESNTILRKRRKDTWIGVVCPSIGPLGL